MSASELEQEISGRAAALLAGPVSFIVGVVLTEFILKPASQALGVLDWALSSVTGMLIWAVRTPLQTAGSAIWDAFLAQRGCGSEGPCGALPAAYNGSIDGLTSLGLAAPVATALANLLVVTFTAGVVYLLLRIGLTYVTGGLSNAAISTLGRFR